jgi:succinate dehydrogenase / fumarate reductase, cytochrome b subunit
MTLKQMLFSSVGKKSFMALSGIILSLFLLIHAVGNSTTFFGRDTFTGYADKLHSLGIIIPIFEISLLLIFIFHIILGITLFLQNYQSRPARYKIQKSSGGRTAGSRTMPYTGTVILVFIIVHLNNFHFTDHNQSIADIVRTVLSDPLFSAFYLASMLALGLHVSHGFWSLCQSLGLNHPKYNTTLRGGAILLTFILCGIYVLIPLSAMLCDKFLL